MEQEMDLRQGIASVALVGLPVPAATAANLPLVTADDPTGKALKYVSDASQASVTQPGSKCANCANYRAAPGPPRVAASCSLARR